MTLYGGIEAGGTKWVCIVSDGPDHTLAHVNFPTTKPDETLARAVDFFREYAKDLAAIGIGTFGPIDVNPQSPTWGYITTTPKPFWQHADVAGAIKQAFNLPVGFDTDVNAAALGEYRWGAAQGLDTFAYLTLGTGIGAGIMANGALVHGLLHPEFGHVMLPHDRERDPFAGACPFHGDCFEGLAAGPALEKRWGQRAETFAPDHPAWELEAHYIALALSNLTYTLAPQRIILGGGVMQQPQMFPLVRAEMQRLINGYLNVPQIMHNMDSFVVPPGLGTRSGALGAIALAQLAAQA